MIHHHAIKPDDSTGGVRQRRQARQGYPRL